MLLEKGENTNAYRRLNDSVLKANWYMGHYKENESCSSDLANCWPITKQNLGEFVLVAITLLAVFFIFSVPIKRELKFRI